MGTGPASAWASADVPGGAPAREVRDGGARHAAQGLRAVRVHGLQEGLDLNTQRFASHRIASQPLLSGVNIEKDEDELG